MSVDFVAAHPERPVIVGFVVIDSMFEHLGKLLLALEAEYFKDVVLPLLVAQRHNQALFLAHVEAVNAAYDGVVVLFVDLDYLLEGVVRRVTHVEHLDALGGGRKDQLLALRLQLGGQVAPARALQLPGLVLLCELPVLHRTFFWRI